MKRTDVLLLGSTLFALAAFVGHEAWNAKRHPLLARESTTSFGSMRGEDDAASMPTVPRPVLRPTVTIFGARRPSLAEEARHRLATNSAGTYISEILAAHDSSLARWGERAGKPLRVWVQPFADIPDWNPAGGAIVQQAFASWREAGVPLNYTFVRDSSSADVRVTWIDRFQEQISGKTLWAHDGNWWIVDAQIVLAVHHRSGEALDESALRAIALHEVGHMVGLDHTADTTNIMTSRVRVRELSDMDKATARLLYLLPPGPMKGR